MSKRKIIYFLKNSNFLYCLFLIFFIGLITEFTLISINKINNDKKEKIKLTQNSSNTLINKNNQNSITYQRTISSMGEFLQKESINFKTDLLGSIYPSSFSNIKEKNKYVLFCGGSTLEASQVKEGLRPSDVFTKKSKLKSINFSKANQSLNGCLRIIDNYHMFLNKSKKNYFYPDFYIIGTNINTLSDFMRTKYSVDNKINLTFGKHTIREIDQFLKKYQINKDFKIKLSEYEHAILDGCCFAPSEINKSSNYRYINWQDEQLVEEYLIYLKNLKTELDQIIKRYQIPKAKIIFLIEPNSFLISDSRFKRDYYGRYDTRQRLHNIQGKEYSNLESSSIIKKFDNICILYYIK